MFHVHGDRVSVVDNKISTIHKNDKKISKIRCFCERNYKWCFQQCKIICISKRIFLFSTVQVKIFLSYWKSKNYESQLVEENHCKSSHWEVFFENSFLQILKCKDSWIIILVKSLEKFCEKNISGWLFPPLGYKCVKYIWLQLLWQLCVVWMGRDEAKNPDT